MGHSKKEEERVERIIRGLLKLPENRRCINCNTLGPQYVCTTFSTFVCTNCSGIHREFTHRVKSVSMAKFTPEEVTAIQAGGNERAKQIYFKGWDPLCHSYPDSGNMHRLRDFIKHVYVDRKYTGERSPENLPKIRLKDKEESYQSKKSSSFNLEFISPRSSSSARSNDSSFRYVYDESRSPKYVQKFSRHGGFSRSPIKFEVVDDRFRDDEYRNRRHSNLESKLRQLSFDGQKNANRFQAPAQRSLGEIMMENDLSPQVKPSGGEASVQENPREQKSNNPKSSIDVSIKPKVSDTVTEAGQEKPSMTQESENNWASFEASTEETVPKTPNTNTMKPCLTEPTPEPKISTPLDLLLLELSGPFAPTTSGDIVPTTTTVEKASTWDFSATSMEETTASSSELAQPSNEAPLTQSELHEAEDSIEVSQEHKPQSEDSIEVSHAQVPSSMQYAPSVSVGCSSATQPTNSPNKDVASNNEPSFSPNTHDSSHAFDEQSSQTTSIPTQDTKPDVTSQPSTVETKSRGRKELPEDLFTTSYLSGPAPHAGWQNVQHHVMGYGMQYYPNAVPPSALPIAPKSMNPFEVNEGRGLTHASSVCTFPSMASMHGVLPAVQNRTGVMHVSSLGSLETMVPQSTSYASQVTGMCFDQVNNDEQHIRSQRVDTFNGNIRSFGSLDTIHQSYGGYGTHGTPNSFSNSRGNPFD